MISNRFRQSVLFSVIVAALALLVMGPAESRAQDTSSSTVQSAITALTGDQQPAANSALCAALGSQASNPAAASLLSSPSVISAAASAFAGSTQLPLSSATSMLQGYVAQHATDILASCAVSNATSGLTSKIPGASNLPSMPQAP
jgi:hypothetical protein